MSWFFVIGLFDWLIGLFVVLFDGRFLRDVFVFTFFMLNLIVGKVCEEKLWSRIGKETAGAMGGGGEKKCKIDRIPCLVGFCRLIHPILHEAWRREFLQERGGGGGWVEWSLIDFPLLRERETQPQRIATRSFPGVTAQEELRNWKSRGARGRKRPDFCPSCSSQAR